jgi:ATP-grasp domain
MSGGADSPRSDLLLLITGRRWHETSRLALAARDAGFSVHLLAPQGHPLAGLDWVRPVGTYSVFQPARSVSRSLNTLPFGLVVPADDLAAAAVFDAYCSGRLNETAARTVRRSLGAPDTFSVRHSRPTIGEIAAEADVAAPGTWAVPGEDALMQVLVDAEFPLVLKSDGSFGGGEVIVVHDSSAACAAYRKLSRPPGIIGSLKRLLSESDAYPLRRSLVRARRNVSVQEFVCGEPATLSGVAWEGEVLGYVAFRVLRTRGEHGPAYVVEPIQHPDMDRAAKAVIGQLGLSGLFGLDFIMSPDRSRASLLELNPRAAQTTHLRLPQRRPLFHLLADRLGVDAPPPRPPLRAQVISLFPQAVMAAAEHVGSMTGYLDVPEAEDVSKLCLSAALEPLPLNMVRRVRQISALARSSRRD